MAALWQTQDRCAPLEGFGGLPAGPFTRAGHDLTCAERLLTGRIAFLDAFPQITCLRLMTGADKELDQILGEGPRGEQRVGSRMRNLYGVG